MTDHEHQITHLIAVAMAELGEEMHRHFQRVVADMDLTPVQAAVLRLAREPIRMGALAEKTHCQPSHMTGVIDTLEQRGWLERTPDPNDRRVLTVLRTDAGERIDEEIVQRLTSSADHPMKNLSLSEQRTLLELLSSASGRQIGDLSLPDHTSRTS